MHSLVKQTLDAFTSNLGTAEECRDLLVRVLGEHERGVFCFRWRRCQRIKQELVSVDERIALYQKAIDGLESGDYEPVITALDVFIPSLDETLLEVAHRIVHSPPPMSASGISPSTVQAGLIRLRDDLRSLQTT